MSSDAYWPNAIVQNPVAVALRGSPSLVTQKTAFGVLTCVRRDGKEDFMR